MLRPVIWQLTSYEAGSMRSTIFDTVHGHGLSFDQMRLLRTVDSAIRSMLPTLPEEVLPQGIRSLDRAPGQPPQLILVFN